MRKRVARKWTYDAVKELVEVTSRSGCVLLTQPSAYTSGSDYLCIKCKCGNPFETKIGNFNHKKKPKQQCNECGQTLKMIPLAAVVLYIEQESNSCCKFIELIDDVYKGSKSKLSLRCACGEPFMTNFNQFKNGNKRRCNKCAKSYTWSYEEVRLFIEVKSESGCRLLSQRYLGIRHKLELECSCGEPFNTNFSTFRDKGARRCKLCANEMRGNFAKFTYEQVKHYIEVESGSGCKLIGGEYKNITSDIHILCACGKEFTTNLKCFRYNKKKPKQHCDQCGNKQRIKNLSHTYEEVKRYIEVESATQCTLISSEEEFQKLNQQTKVTDLKLRILCGQCKTTIFITRFNTFKSKGKHTCDKCGKLHYTYDEVKHMIEVESKSGAKLLSKNFNSAMEKLDLLCACGKPFSVTYSTFKDPKKLKQKCNSCTGNLSKMEIAIESFLKDIAHIHYETQFTFPDCRRIYPLRFDFAIFFKEKLLFLVEADGSQHDEIVNYWGGEEGLVYRQENDRIKNQYCHDSNIRLIRISHNQKTEIKSILDGYIQESLLMEV